MKYYKLLLILTLLVGFSSLALAVPSGGLAYYNFNETFDQWNDYNLTNNGATNSASYPSFNVSGDSSPYSFDFSGTSQYLDVTGSDADFDFTSNEMSISLWFKSDTTAGTNRLISFPYNEGAGSVKYTLVVDTNRIQWLLYDTVPAVKQVEKDPFTDTSSWHHVVADYNGTHVNLYVDNVLEDSVASTNNIRATDDGSFNIGRFGTNYDQGFNGQIDEVKIFNRSLNTTEIDNLFKFGVSINESGAPSYFDITSESIWSGSSINTFTADINGTEYHTTNGTINTGILSNSSSLYNITLNVTGSYFDYTELNYNVSSDLNAEMKQSEIAFACYEKVTNNSLPCNATIYPDAGSYNFSISSTGYYDEITEQIISALDNKTINVYNFSNSWLNVSAINVRTNATISNFTLIFTDLDNSWTETLTADGLYLNNTLIEGRNYSVEINAIGYEHKTINFTNLTGQDYEFELYTANSVLINIFKESDGSRIYDNVTIRFTDTNSTVTEYITNTSIQYVDSLNVDNYTIGFISDNYSTRTYSITVGNNTFQTLNAYLVDDGVGATIFEFQDKNTGATLEGVTLTVQKLINATWTIVEVLTSDVTGRTSFDYIDDETYRFISFFSGYQTKTFTLDPILFSSYTIKMDPTITQDDDSDYSGVNIYYDPSIYYNDANNSIEFTFISPSGSFVTYGFNATYNATTVSNSGVNAYGSVETATLEITGAGISDLVVVNYYYTLSDGNTKSYTKTFIIDGASANTGTWLQTMRTDWGLGIFERILIVVGLIMLLAGAVTYYGGATAGGVIAMFLLGFFGYTTFITWWAILPTMIVLFIILTWRSLL